MMTTREDMIMLKIGIQTAGLLQHHGIDGTFALLKKCGFDFVDFSMNALDMSLKDLRSKPDPLESAFDRSLAELITVLKPYEAAARTHGITFGQAHAPYPSFWPGNDDRCARMIEIYKKMIALCGQLGCKYLIIHPAAQRNLREDWQANMSIYKPLIPALERHGVICCLENLYTGSNGGYLESSCADPYEACDYIDELNDAAGAKRFAFCLDTGHALMTGRDIYTGIMKLGPRLEALHIHDNDGLNDQHVAPYMGILDWDRFIAGLRDAEYAGGLSFETVSCVTGFDPELHEELLSLISATGRLFARRVSEP